MTTQVRVTRRNTLLGGTTLAAAAAVGGGWPNGVSPVSAQTVPGPQDPRGAEIKDELLYQRATQSYLWALPLLNMRAMMEGSERRSAPATTSCRPGSNA